MSDYPLGQTVRPIATFKVNGEPKDPTLVTCEVRAPSGTTTTPAPTQTAVGVWGIDLTLSEVGVWAYRFEGTGAVLGVVDGTVVARMSPVTAPGPGYTYDLATAVGKVRLYVDDHDFSAIDLAKPPDQRSAIFTDAELEVLIAQQGGVYRAAADALRIIAASRALLVQSRRISETVVDYGSARADLLKQADAYQSLGDQLDGGLAAPADGIAPQGWNDFSERRIIIDQWMRRS